MSFWGAFMAETPRVAIVLPRFARYQARGATSIDLYAHDSVRFSTLPGITVIGPPCAAPFPDGGTYVTVPADDGWRQQVLQALRDRQPDVVEVHQDINLAAWLARHLPMPVTAIRHNTQKLPKAWIRRFFKNLQWNAIAAFAFVSEFLRTEFCAALPDFLARAHVLYNGIDPDAWAPPAGTEREKLIVYVGRLVPEKGIAPLIEAAEEILTRHPDWNLHILCGDPTNADPDAVALVDAFAKQHASQVTVEGPVPYADLPNHLHRAAIAVVPSLWPEPFGRTAVEAMAAGCALVASRRGGLAEILDETTALPVEPVTGKALSTALNRLIENPEQRQHLAMAGQAAAKAKFALESSIARHDLLRRALAARLPVLPAAAMLRRD